MEQGPLTHQILERFTALPPQMRAAARYIVERPNDVALLSMREQARQAGVMPATMTRLAQRLGYDGYEEVRNIYAAAIRAGQVGFAGRGGRQVAEQREKGDLGLAAAFLAATETSLRQLNEPAALASLAAAAEMLSAARRIYCLGLRASYPLAWIFAYLVGLFGERAVVLDGAAGLLADEAAAISPDDVILAFSFDPYTRITIDVAQRAHDQGIAIVAVTDSQVSPLARIAAQSILVSPETPSFFRTMTPAFAVAEILAALVAGHGGEAALAALTETEKRLAERNVHWIDPESRRQT